MKVVYFHTGNWYGGVEKLLVYLFDYQEFTPEIEPVFVLCYEGILSRELKKRGAIVELVPSPEESKPWTLFSTRLKLWEILKKYECHVVVSHEIDNHVVAWPVEKHGEIKSVLWIHSSGFRLRQPVYQQLRDRIPDVAICTSRHVQAEVNELWPTLKTNYLYPPYEKSKLQFKPKSSGLEKTVTFMYVGRMVDYKGLSDIVEALGRISHLPFRFIAVGGQKMEREQRYMKQNIERVKELNIEDKVEFVGHQKKVFDLLMTADVFVHPNKLPEPLGLVFIEALLAGLPVVATNIGGAREILNTQSLKMGDLVPPNDVESLAAVLKKYIEDEVYRKQISKNVQEGFVNICEPALSMKKLSDILHSLDNQPIIK